MRTFSVKNFERFQHYKDRSPKWIKLYNELLDDYDFGRLRDASKMHLVAIWLLASRYDNKIPYDPDWVAKRINATEPINLGDLAQAGFIVVEQDGTELVQDAINALATCLPREEKRREENINAPAPNGAHLESVPSPPAIPDPEKEYYTAAKKLLGNRDGGSMGSLLLKSKGGNVALAHAALLTASTKVDKREYIAAIIHGKRDGPQSARERGDAW